MMKTILAIAGLAMSLALGAANAQEGGVRALFEARIDASVRAKVADAEAQGLVRRSISVDAIARDYLFLPARRPDAPLLIVLHGGAMSAERSLAIEYGGAWLARAQADGFALAFPQGALEAQGASARNWNDCRAPSRSEGDGGVKPDLAPDSTLDDVAFIQALRDALIANDGIDPKRVYVAGASNGGMMALRLLLEAPDRFAGFAPSIASLPELSECPAAPRAIKPVLYTYGTADQFVPAAGGCVADADGACARGRILSQADAIARLAQAFGASPQPPRAIADAAPNDGASQTEIDYKTPEGALVLRVVRIDGGGHTSPAPGEGSAFAERMFGKTSRDRHAVDYIAEFFALAR